MGKGSGSCDSRPALSIFGVSDLHLGPGAGKGHFSSNWEDHQSKLRKSWDERIHADDVVLLPGDFSWHRDPADLRYDYLWIDERPGQMKVLSPGNHDYGVWSSEEQANEFLGQFKTQTAVMDNAIRIQNPLAPDGSGMVIAAAQGSQSPGDQYFNTNAGASAHGKENESVRFLGELVALDQAIRHGQELKKQGDAFVIMIHYPPFINGHHESIFSKMIERSGADLCVYGHLHQKEQFRKTVQGQRNGVEYRFLGADFLRFSPTKIAEWTQDGLEFAPIEVVGRDAWPEPKKYTSTTTTYGSSSYKGSSSTKSSTSKREQKTNASGKALECKECGQKIYTDESYHYVPGGSIHDKGGKVTYGLTGTCQYVNATGKPTDNSKPSTTSSTSSTKQSKTWGINEAGAKCEDCGGVMKAGDRYHETSSGVVHGPGAYNQRNTCFHRDKNKSGGGKGNKKNKGNNSGPKTPQPERHCAVCNDRVGAPPLKLWSRLKDDSIICNECKSTMPTAA